MALFSKSGRAKSTLGHPSGTHHTLYLHQFKLSRLTASGFVANIPWKGLTLALSMLCTTDSQHRAAAMNREFLSVIPIFHTLRLPVQHILALVYLSCLVSLALDSCE